MRQRIAFVIPAYNEEQSIATVVSTVARYGTAIVVDDGSTDRTVALAKKAGAVVVNHSTNMGYDAALETGLCKAIGLGMTYAITFDGDGQHTSECIEKFLNAVNTGADMIVGVRDHLQRFSEHVFSIVGRLCWGIRDPLCGIKGYRLLLLKNLGRINTYPSIGTEIAIRLARQKRQIVQVPITIAPRIGASRFGGGWRPNSKILKALLYGLFQPHNTP